MRCCKVDIRDIQEVQSMYRSKFILWPKRLIVRNSDSKLSMITYETRWLERCDILYKKHWNKRRKWSMWQATAFIDKKINSC
jgi:hypothetical protein